MNQITTQYVTENGACYEQYVITDPAAKTSLTITPELDDDHILTEKINARETSKLMNIDYDLCCLLFQAYGAEHRSEEHTSELQSR